MPTILYGLEYTLDTDTGYTSGEFQGSEALLVKPAQKPTRS
jgi:hypothetical protein